MYDTRHCCVSAAASSEPRPDAAAAAAAPAPSRNGKDEAGDALSGAMSPPPRPPPPRCLPRTRLTGDAAAAAAESVGSAGDSAVRLRPRPRPGVEGDAATVARPGDGDGASCASGRNAAEIRALRTVPSVGGFTASGRMLLSVRQVGRSSDTGASQGSMYPAAANLSQPCRKRCDTAGTSVLGSIR